MATEKSYGCRSLDLSNDCMHSLKKGEIELKILSFYLTKSFKLIMEFDNQEYRLLDMKDFLKNEKGLLKDLANEINFCLCPLNMMKFLGIFVGVMM